MKTYKYIALAALVLGFTACSQDEDFTPQQEDIVQIASANIATEVQTRVNTLGDGESWENTDKILLVNGSRDTKNSGIYTAAVTTGDNPTTTWKLTEGMVLYHSSDKVTNDFTAYYPASEEFELPVDQTDEAKIKSADRMVATTTGVAKGTAVALNFERQNAKITITPTFATQYEGKKIGDISEFKINGVKPYLPVGGDAYTAIIEPSEIGFGVTFMVGADDLTATSTTKIEAGNHYTFSLTVGKNVVNLTNVSVTKWTEQPISDVETDEIVEVSTLEDFEAAIAEGGIVVMTGNIMLDDKLPDFDNATIDLNGYTLTPHSTIGLFISRGTLTLTGEGTVNGDVWAVEEGTVNLQGGTVEGYFYVDFGGTANISGGHVETLNVMGEGTATITGGHVETLNVMGEGTATITGGTFGEDPSDYLADGYTVTEADGIWTVTPSNN